ncbi:MAG: hypothetical protein NC215_00205 [Ruminococcus sp.]|nr:hypothetical protein [Ruminococcus sp.]
MSRITWDDVGKRFFETGVEQCVLYQQKQGVYPKGVAWNGISKITEKPSGAEATAFYADNIKYLSIRAAEDFGATLEAFYYPDEFAECDGSVEVVAGVTIGQQGRKPFGLSYRTILGNDEESTDYGYKLHLVYGATASPSEKENETINENPNAATMSWECETTPVSVKNYKPTSHIVFDSTKVDKVKLAELEDILYGTEEKEARLPLPDEVFALFGDTVDSLSEDY